MPKSFKKNISDVVENLSFQDLLEEVNFDLRIKEFVVLEVDCAIYNVQINTPLRSDYFTVFLVENGSVTFSLIDHSMEAKKGDVVFCPMQETFTIDHISEDYKSKYIFFSLFFISEAGFNYKSNDILKSLSSDPTYIIRNKPEIYRRINFHLDELASLNNQEKENYYFNEMIWHHFSLVIYEIDNYFRRTEKVSQESYRKEEITTQFFTLVREHYKEQHNVQFYADQLFISRKYLTKVINDTMQKSPKEIIDQVLSIEARILIRSSNISVNEVSAMLNFPDQASFSKYFKKHIGKSPLKYKKSDLY